MPILIDGVYGVLEKELTKKLPRDDFTKSGIWGDIFRDPPNRQRSKGIVTPNLSSSLGSLIIPSSQPTQRQGRSKHHILSAEKIDDSDDGEEVRVIPGMRLCPFDC
jgi:hypothetical protein